MPLPPGARVLDVAEVRRAFAAGALGAVGHDARSEYVERDGVAADTDGAYGDAMAEHARQSRLRRWQASTARPDLPDA